MKDLKNSELEKEISEHDKKRYSSNQLWIRICLIIILNLVLLIIWCFTSRTEQDFVSHFSFASTVTSIILSVLAIFISVSGESKTQIIRDRIEEEANDITELTRRLENKIEELSNRIEIVIHNTDNIKAVIREPNEAPQIVSGTEKNKNNCDENEI